MAALLPITGSPNCVDNPELYDRIRLAGQQSPGIARFPSAPKRLTGWDLQVPQGGGGFTLLRKQPPIKFSVTLELWKGDGPEGEDVDEFETWNTWKKILSQKIPPPVFTGSQFAASSLKALSIYHPLLAGLSPAVTDVVVEGWTESIPDGTGRGTVTIDFLEYRPFLRRPVAALNGTTTNKLEANSDVKAQLAAAVKANQAEFAQP